MHIIKDAIKDMLMFFGLKLVRFSRDTGHSLPEEQASEPYPIKLHGFDVHLNGGNTYPHITKALPYFNAPLVELVNQAHGALGRKISFIDVGAATGDTILLLEQRCAGKVESYVCFEGDDEFETLLKANMRQFRNVKIVTSLLASEHKSIPSLHKHHQGSASATGNNLQTAKPLDAFASEFSRGMDVLKIDVDGFDGEVLQGAKSLLSTYKPWVIFEWHPALILRAKTDYGSAFDALRDSGYKRFAWFHNTGHFSHFSDVPSAILLETMNQYLLQVNARSDEHFDVVALPDAAPHVELELASMDYARAAAFSMPVQ